ncbi:putative glycerol-3-phosphate 1-O-acyltransferase [Helianthus annuus]|uniref:Glycerol-3-phosphate 1-O-acyltransferase n=1 Tax=Helianthus annuus TaxID=4232 RepID=A0A251THF1_HELAN|nr:probable glycerol-3-phosphate acyltransferase 3 [Helianthus annuus]KAF5785239.1 putative glycerol-3-phosphate 1-O-acyltransferase [Helianthus annuus]KAJ0513611.1 putative glycerol-3-phosphate 1-O-acyltransferase [Helianthus annuus]KAJ0528945.1 putative glycerol-3-phosphate 1-O-acyltransferase [Helianthus annuus]KAJ0695861.1 putative glycerol-3-phosphate 1-O-acyltransferase [Helianthus annuus]
MELKALPKPLKFILFVSRVLLKLHKNQKKALRRTLSNTHGSSFKSQTLISEVDHTNLSQKTLIFDVEETLLRSSSVFPYFMLVAFEAGSLIRAFMLFALYPLLFLVDDELSIKIMVMVSFFGTKKDGFRVGSSVLPKFFLEDVGVEGFDVLRRGKKTVGVSKLPQIMVECFLKDYLEIDYVFGRELKVHGDYFVGLMNDNKNIIEHRINEMLEEDDQAIYFSNKFAKHDWISCSKEVYVVRNGEKKAWQILPKERYPKDLIFHDGRLAFRPEPLRMLVMFMWFPFAILLSIFRTIIALTMPYGALIPILAFTGLQLKLTNNNSNLDVTSDDHKQHKGRLYVCNHRTLLDPLYLSFGLKRPFAAVTYSLSRMSEILSPIKTVRLTRDRDQDAKTMDKMLRLGDLVVCPEGTTCREPYLLRFSPLFAELSDHIVPVALDSYVTMFYGTTAGGLKCLDPFLFMMNPNPVYRVQFLDQIHGVSSQASETKSTRFDIANYVQSEIGKTLDFECTSLTRKDKYLVLAGNEGFVNSTSNKR